MGSFVYDDDIDRLVVGDDWIDLKRRLTWGDVDKLSASDLRGLQVGQAITPLLETIIKGWSLKDREGNIAPITEEWISRLDLEVFNLILERLRENNPSFFGGIA